MHALLARQLRRLLNYDDLTQAPEALQHFLLAVDQAYRQADDDRALLEQSLEITSQEFLGRYEQLSKEVERRKQSEADAAQLLSMHRATLEATGDGILVVDLHGHIVSYNRRFLELWRIPDRVAASRDDQQFLAYVMDQLSDPNMFLSEVLRLYVHPDEPSQDVLRFTDGRVFERSSHPQHVNGTTVGRVWNFHDVTEHKQAEVKLADYARRLEQSNKELNDFNFIVSHDLKEPLRSLDAFSKFLLEGYQDRLDEQGRDHLMRIRTNARRLHRVIEDLLQVSRLSRFPNHPQAVNLHDVIGEVRERFERALQERRARLVAPESLPTIVCDRARITMVFNQLVANAIAYNDKPDCRIEIAYTPIEGAHQLSVRDNGPGIDPQYFQKIFDIFQRLGRKEDHEGTGIGLTIVKKVIELHQGRVWVESVLGEGTTFYFTISMDEAALHSVPEAAAGHHPEAVEAVEPSETV